MNIHKNKPNTKIILNTNQTQLNSNLMYILTQHKYKIYQGKCKLKALMLFLCVYRKYNFFSLFYNIQRNSDEMTQIMSK